jgi:hypothetical protein
MSKQFQESGQAKYMLSSTSNPKGSNYFEEVMIKDDETLYGLISVFEQALKESARNYEPPPKKEYSRFSDLDVV